MDCKVGLIDELEHILPPFSAIASDWWKKRNELQVMRLRRKTQKKLTRLGIKLSPECLTFPFF